MTKITSLTSAQISLMYDIRDKWINNLTTLKLDKDKVRKGLEFLYPLAGLECPSSIVFVDSPLDMQYAYHRLSNLKHSVMDSIYDIINDSVYASVRFSVRNSVEDSVRNTLYNSVWDHVRDSIRDSIRDSVRVSVRDFIDMTQQLNYQSMSSVGSINDWYWVAFYDYFQKIGVELTPKFSTFRDFCCLSGAYDYLLYKDCAIVCSLPSSIEWDNVNGIKIASSTTSPAIEWKSGLKIFIIRGTTVPEHVVLSPHTITIEEIQNESNQEVRRIIIEQYGTEKYLQDIKARIIDFDIKGVNNGARMLLKDPGGTKWLLVTDGSTDRLYTMTVDSNLESCSKAHTSLCGFDENLIKMEG